MIESQPTKDIASIAEKGTRIMIELIKHNDNQSLSLPTLFGGEITLPLEDSPIEAKT
jgi:hypothetical protein